MNATECFKAGALAQAIDAQTQVVKTQPADQGKRLFLFELLAFTGDLDRAQRQIDVLHYDDPMVEATVQGYRKLLDSERRRRQTFAEGTAPQFYQPPPEHVKLRLAAFQELRNGQTAQAAALLQQADQQAPTLKGTCNGSPFEVWRDADDRFGPVLEVMAHGIYSWVPLEQVSSLAMNAPSAPRDLLWVPARLTMRDGASGDVFLPALYPNSHASTDSLIQLGRKTDWLEGGAGPVCGLGTRTFLVGEEGLSILELREIDFE